jgi:hypothetical protein
MLLGAKSGFYGSMVSYPRLEAAGRGNSQTGDVARQLLRSMQQSLALHIADRDRLRDWLTWHARRVKCRIATSARPFGSSVGGGHGQKSRAADHPQDGPAERHP